MNIGTSTTWVLVTIYGLSGCMGGGSGGGGSVGQNSGTSGGGTTVTIDQGDGDFPPPSSDPAAPGTNGLDYGSTGQSLSQIEGRAVSMRAVGFRTAASPGVTDATITLAAGFFDVAATTQDKDGVIEIFSESVTITNGAGILTNGDEVRIAFEPDRAGEFAAIVDATVSNSGGINGETIFVFGFETDPDYLAGLDNANVDYIGSFQASGAYGLAQDTQYEGTITITADFRNTGSASVDLDGRFNNARDVDLNSGNFAISNGAFAGNLACVVGCTGTGSRIDAQFYGPTASEVGGVLAMDINVAGTAYSGVGSFIIGRD